MALSGKLEAELEMKSPPEKFYNIFKAQAYHVPTASPNNIQAVEVHEGDWETGGSVKLWNYSVGGKAETYKERIELDDENMTISLVGLEGDVFKYYKSFKPVFKLAPKGEGSLAKLIIEYEKLKENVPAPDKYMDFMISLTKDIDAHLVKA